METAAVSSGSGRGARSGATGATGAAEAAEAAGAGISRRRPGGEGRGREGEEGRFANSGPRRRHPVYGPAACAPTAPCAGTGRPQDSPRVVPCVLPDRLLLGDFLGFGTAWGRARELRTAACRKAA